MGLASVKSIAWEAEVAAGPGRHHLRVAVDAEARFWAIYDAGTGADAAASAAGAPHFAWSSPAETPATRSEATRSSRPTHPKR
jgi:hypothetical protein